MQEYPGTICKEVIPFIPEEIGKWRGNVQLNGECMETVPDIPAITKDFALVGENLSY